MDLNRKFSIQVSVVVGLTTLISILTLVLGQLLGRQNRQIVHNERLLAASFDVTKTIKQQDARITELSNEKEILENRLALLRQEKEQLLEALSTESGKID